MVGCINDCYVRLICLLVKLYILLIYFDHLTLNVFIIYPCLINKVFYFTQSSFEKGDKSQGYLTLDQSPVTIQVLLFVQFFLINQSRIVISICILCFFCKFSFVHLHNMLVSFSVVLIKGLDHREPLGITSVRLYLEYNECQPLSVIVQYNNQCYTKILTVAAT